MTKHVPARTAVPSPPVLLAAEVVGQLVAVVRTMSEERVIRARIEADRQAELAQLAAAQRLIDRALEGRFAERVLLIEKLSDFINGPSAQASPEAAAAAIEALVAMVATPPWQGIAEVTAGLPGGGAGPTVVDGEWA